MPTGAPIQKINLKKYRQVAKRNKKQLETEIYGILRQIVMKRDGAKCLRCGKTDRLHLSHIYPRGKYKTMALEPLNLKMLCVGCHLYWWHKNPMEAWEWLNEVMSKERIQKLKVMSQSYGKIPDLQLLKIALQKELTQ